MSAPFAAVAGWPVNHSLSPVMMRAWLDAAQIKGAYGRAEVEADKAHALFRSLPDLGWAGVNVTAPHKEIALAAADHVTEGAALIGAANLLTVGEDQSLTADNTDIIGIAEALIEDDPSTPAVLIGAGGAARAALFHLANQDREITVVNRTQSKAETLVADYDRPISISADLQEAVSGAGLVINATTLGMKNQPALQPDFSNTRDDALVFDMVYAPLETPLLKAARAVHRKTSDGLNMLIGQAKPSFEAFFGQPPPGIDMKSTLVTALGAKP